MQTCAVVGVTGVQPFKNKDRERDFEFTVKTDFPPVREGETIEGSRTMRNPDPIQCSSAHDHVSDRGVKAVAVTTPAPRRRLHSPSPQRSTVSRTDSRHRKSTTVNSPEEGAEGADLLKYDVSHALSLMSEIIPRASGARTSTSDGLARTHTWRQVFLQWELRI